MLVRPLLVAFVFVVSTAAQKPLLVSAAISLTDALTEIAALYKADGGEEVQFNFAGSNVLARQIVNGAPADLFISADAVQMQLVMSNGAAEPPIQLLRNRLAIVTPSGEKASVPDVRALAGLRRIAVGDPAAVPAGVYAREYLQKSGIWASVEPRLLPLANVRTALNAVAAGAADAGIVYESDTLSARVDVAFVVDGPQAPAIIYPAAIVKRSTQKPAATRFLAFLRGSRAATVFRKFKFIPLASSVPPHP